jgi:UDP-4-amino-4-deoxy-L-arabinose formyltransferase/UDP-glucuronic acid dehydrogenase (UDP-4-keto-hexauronic acid decarboxylating)
MKIAIIGRTEILYDTIVEVIKKGYEIPLIITAKEAPEYTKTSNDFKHLANEIGAKFLHAPKLNTQEVKDVIESCGDMDIALSFNYSSIIDDEIIALFRLGILNAHGGDLPKYRGNACQAWAILNGETRIGLCIHSMVGGEMDSGNIIDRDYLEIDINTKIGYIWDWKRSRIPNMFIHSAEQLYKNNYYYIEEQSKNPKDALRCYPRTPEDGRIDWTKSNIEILRLINASNKPYGGAYGVFEDKKIIIWDAELYADNEHYLATIGQVAEINKDGTIIVITGDGKLKINSVEYNSIETLPANIITSIRKRLK